MAAAAPFVPMMIGAGLGAAMNRDNPLAGAALGAVGGAVAGPALGAAGSALGSGAGAAGAAQAGAYGAALAPAGVGAEQAAMLASQTGGMAGGLGHTVGSFGASAQPGLSGLGMGSMFKPENMALQGMKMLGGQPQQRPVPLAPPGAPVQRQPMQPTSFASLSPYGRRRGLVG